MKCKLNQERETENENSKRESQTEVDNGVHPLHWATSPGPSLMGTNPINGFKNGTKWFLNLLTSTSQL